MRRWIIFALICSACGGEQTEPNADRADVGVDVGVDMFDAAIPDPPRRLSPCEATSCRQGSIGGLPCSAASVSDDFSAAEFGVHAYSSMIWDGGQTHIRVEATGGEWTPLIILARRNGEVLFDGDVGAVRPPFDVEASSDADILVSTAQATAIVVYVTSKESLDSNFESGLPPDAAYTLFMDADCGERVRCVVNGRDTGEPECSWLHYVGWRVLPRLEGDGGERAVMGAYAAWWALKEGQMSFTNPIGRATCADEETGPLDVCASNWRVGLAAVDVDGREVTDLEAVAAARYGGAQPSGVLRATANEAGLDQAEVTAVMESTGPLRASWLLRNSAVGFAVQGVEVERRCVSGDEADCFGAGSAASRYYAANRDVALQSIEDLFGLFEQMAQ